MEQTNNFKFYNIYPHQSEKEVCLNENFAKLDALIHPSLADWKLETLPAEKIEGKLYNIEDKIAFYLNGWRYIKLKAGMIFWLEIKNKLVIYTGTGWNEILLQSL